jgi:hypothetical protein
LKQGAHSLEHTPRLAALLRALRTRLVRRIWTFGLGRLATIAGAWAALTFLLDRTLELPRALRLVSLVAFGAYFLWETRRCLVRALRRMPDDARLALIAERGLAQREELFVSAVQLQRELGQGHGALHDELARSVVARAEAAAAGVRTEDLVEFTAPRKSAALGVAALTAAALPLVLSPLAGVFAARLFGADVDWPQRTQLALDVLSGAIVEQDGEDFTLTVPRGGDLSLAVRALGDLPKEVELASESALPQILLPGGDGVFRTVLRSVTRDDVLRLSGGDDDDGPRARLVIVDPPDLAGVVFDVEPPAYTGLAPRRFEGTGATGLVGSVVRVYARPRPNDAAARLFMLPTERIVEPLRQPVPADLALVLGEGDVLFHEFVLEESLRLRFELTDARGLTSPEPALFALDATIDRAPELVRLVPTRSDVETSSLGAVRIVSTVRDDFGVGDVRWSVRTGGDGPALGEGVLTPLALPEGVPGEWYVSLLLELAPLLGTGAEGGVELEIVFETSDLAVPPHVGRDESLRVRVLSGDELLRRVKDRLAKAREQASRLSERLLEARRRCEELADLIDASGATSGEELSGLRTALALARRTESDGQALLRELTSVVEMVLYARLDDKAEPLLLALDRELGARRSRAFELDPWRNLVAEQARAPLVDEGFGVHLVSIAALGVELVDGPLAAGANALDSAAAADDADRLGAALATSAGEATKALALVESLLERLSEWDNYQSVLSLARDLLERQKALSERTRRYATDR